MAKLLGIYETVSALNTAHASDNTKGDTYLVGTKTPYYMYAWDGSAFKKGETVSDKATEITSDTSVDDLYNMEFKGADGKTLKIRKGLHLGEIHFYVPLSE